jgi:hypothetical protein
VKKIILIAIILILGVSFAGFTQTSGGEEKFFAKTLPIYKIYTHSLGYKVIYHKVGMGLGVLYLPFNWFTDVDSPGDIVTGTDNSYPYFTVFYRDGKFDHIRLFVQESKDHLSWSILYVTTEEANKFFNVDISTFKVEY